MGQAGEAVLYLLPSEMGYLEWLAEAGCKVEPMDPEEALRALPPSPGRFVILFSLSFFPFFLSLAMLSDHDIPLLRHQ